MTGQQHGIPADLQALHGTTTEVEEVHVTEDADGIPAFIKVDRELAGVVIVPSLLVPRTPAASGVARTPATGCKARRADHAGSPDETRLSPMQHHQEGASL